MTLKDYLNTMIGDIVLYGAGGFGKELANVFISHNIQPIAFLDKKITGTVENIDVFHPTKFNDKNVTVILSIVLHKTVRNEVINYLKELGYKNIIDGQVIRAHYVDFEQDYKLVMSDRLKPLSYLADEESILAYKQNVESHLSRNYENYFESDDYMQYFAKIENNNRFQTFVDCGAYIGDTLLEALKNNIEIETYYGFEPISENFKKLQDNTKNISATIYNAGVSNSSGLLYFDNKLGSSNANQNGKTPVQVVKLDDVLNDVYIDFLKMDIEGEEINALLGAKNMIHKHKPNMAICVYHYINHFWDIPNMINDWDLGYTFYMRAHSSACMETVLYAIQGEK